LSSFDAACHLFSNIAARCCVIGAHHCVNCVVHFMIAEEQCNRKKCVADLLPVLFGEAGLTVLQFSDSFCVRLGVVL
jgi:hypothetical protein